MRRLFIQICCFVIPLFGAAAANRFLGYVYDYGFNANRPVYDLGSNYNGYGAVADHTVFFKPFPYTDTICLWTGYYNWHGQTVNLCSGYSTSFMNQSNKTNVAETARGCWRWNCNSGHFMMTGGECVNQSTCQSRNLVWEDNQCKTASFCAGWTGYSSSAYTLTNKIGNCYEFRCQNGGFVSQTNRACRTETPTNVTNVPEARGGWYVNNNTTDANRGVLIKCPDNQYVTFGPNNVFLCKDVEYRASSSFNDCWKCTNKPDLIQCVMNNGSNPPSGCK